MTNISRVYSRFLLIFFITLVMFFHCDNPGDNPTTRQTNEGKPSANVSFSKEVKEILEKKKNLLKELISNPRLVEAVKSLGEKNQSLTEQEIARLDEDWQKSTEITEFIKQFITNQTAQLIFQFRDNHDEFTEIFITDKRGLIVGESNRTSDYYQADEDWWRKTYNGGKGHIFFGEIEYDESSRTEAIPIYMPVLDLKTRAVIGIMKAVLDITAIKLEL